MRLIDATNAIESIDEIVCSMSVCINSDYYNGMRTMKDMALHAIEKQPTVDAVPREWWNALRVEINDFKRGTEFDIGSDLWFATNHLINLMDAFEKGGMFYASSADGERREK